MLSYDIRVVADTALPVGHDWALIQHGQRMTLVMKQKSKDDLCVRAQAWAAYRLSVRRRIAAAVPMVARQRTGA